MIKVRVPATTANLGPGFDSLGIALNLYNYFIIEEIEEGLETINIEQSSGRSLEIPLSENLFVKAMEKVYQRLNKKMDGLKVTEEINIPFARGLGSSASAVVAGLLAANYILGKPLKEEELMEIAVDMEGHPDNVLPAFKGGFIVNVITDDGLVHKKLEITEELSFIVLIPDFELKTEDVRKVLPTKISYTDAIYNLSRVALLTASFYDKDFKILKTAMEDRLHQDYRSRLIPGFYQLMDAAYNEGAIGFALSGSGPSVLAIAEQNANNIGKVMVDEYKKQGISSKFLIKTVDNYGCKVTVSR